MAERSPRGLRRYLIALLIVYVAKQLVVAFVSPPFTGHDEVAHFAGIRIVATQARMPTLWSDTLPPDLYRYRAYTIEWRGVNDSPLYTAIHPPLYYVLMAPLYRAAARYTPETIQYVLRCASIPFGVAVVLLAAALTRTLFPGDAFLGVTVPTVVAFQPQVSYEAAMVNNDALATAMYSAALYGIVLMIRDGPTTRRAAALGLLAGVSLLAKATTVNLLVLIVLAVWLARRGTWSTALRQTAVACGVAAAVIGPWWWFMARTYGDPMAFSAIAATQADLTRSDETFLHLLFSGRFLVDRWVETWGEFGWRLIHVSPALLVALGVAAAACVGGLVSIVTVERPRDPQKAWRRQALAIVAAACVLSYLATVQFGVHFVLSQARYFFPVIDAAALLMMLGLRAWVPAASRAIVQTAVLFVAIAVNITIYTAYVVPYWYFR